MKIKYLYDTSNSYLFSDYLRWKGWELFQEGNFKLAIAAYSWAIAFNPVFYGTKPKYLLERGRVFKKIKQDDLAAEDSNRVEKIKSTYTTVYEADHRGRELPVYPYTDRIFNDFCLAVNLGGTQDAVLFLSCGMAYLTKGDKDKAYNNFCLAIDADTFLADVFNKAGNKIYDEAIRKIKTAIKKDMEITHSVNERKNVPEKYENVIQGDFYDKLKQFIELHGKDFLDKNNFNAVFADFLKGEFKKEARILKQLLKMRLHKEIQGTKNVVDIFHHITL